jgi:hypothetical protein
VDDPRDSRPGVPPGQARVLHFRKASPPNGTTKSSESVGELTAADLFALLWQALADILGTAAAATLLRRAAQRAGADWPELTALSITRGALEYQYEVPQAWSEPAPKPPQALCELVRELWPLLLELTGSVVVNRLSQVAELRDRGIAPPTERQP